jgi:hypothetical protein
MRADVWMYPIRALEDQYKIIAPDAYALQGMYDIIAASDTLATILDGEGAQQEIIIGLSAGGGWAHAVGGQSALLDASRWRRGSSPHRGFGLFALCADLVAIGDKEALVT